MAHGVEPDVLDRRAFLARARALAAASLSTRVSRGDDRPPHHAPRARRVVHICLCGGLSHVDSFDHKPLLARLHGKPLPVSERPDTFFGNVGLLKRPDWEFRQRGESGLWVSDWYPHIARHTDDLAVILACWADGLNHVGSVCQMNTGSSIP